MPEPIENAYFNWLCAKIKKDNVNIYYDLLEILHTTEFIWLLPKDEDRAKDGLELREDFVRETRFEPEPGWLITGCSVLELLIAFAKRANFQTDIPTDVLFWSFIQNLELGEFRQLSRHDVPVVEQILYNFVWRLYDDNGNGGLFPMRWPKHDQRSLDIWYQYCEYVDEQQLI